MADTAGVATELIGVLDMGASAIRLVVAEIDPKRSDPHHRGGVARRAARARHVLGRRDPLADRSTPRSTALEGFRRIMDGYGVDAACARSPRARSARRATRDMFLDRIQRRTGIAFEIINEAEESRLVFLAVRHALRRHAALQAAPDAADRGRRRQHQPDAAAPGTADPLRRLRAGRGPAPPAARPPAAHPRAAGRAAEALHRQRRRGNPRSRSRSSASPTWWRSAATCASPPRS